MKVGVCVCVCVCAGMRMCGKNYITMYYHMV